MTEKISPPPELSAEDLAVFTAASPRSQRGIVAQHEEVKANEATRGRALRTMQRGLQKVHAGFQTKLEGYLLIAEGAADARETFVSNQLYGAWLRAHDDELPYGSETIRKYRFLVITPDGAREPRIGQHVRAAWEREVEQNDSPRWRGPNIMQKIEEAYASLGIPSPNVYKLNATPAESARPQLEVANVTPEAARRLGNDLREAGIVRITPPANMLRGAAMLMRATMEGNREGIEATLRRTHEQGVEAQTDALIEHLVSIYEPITITGKRPVTPPTVTISNTDPVKYAEAAEA